MNIAVQSVKPQAQPMSVNCKPSAMERSSPGKPGNHIQNFTAKFLPVWLNFMNTLHEHIGDIDIYLLDQVLKGRFSPSMKILDAGCGGGRNIIYFLREGYQVYGAYRRTSSVNFWRIEELGVAQHPNLHLVEYDLTDLSSSIRLLQTSGATEVYNLAAQSFVGVSFDQPITC